MSFLSLYIEYASEFTDSPIVIHHRVGMSLLSIVLNRKVWLTQGHRKVFPNLWTIIVAPSSFSRKSYSLSIGEDILRQVSPELILPKEFSHEKFIDIMAEQPKGLLILYEFRTFMGVMSKDYMAGTQSLLTELFDCPEIYDRKIKSNSVKIEQPFLNILSASTMDWLRNSVKADDIAGGFLPRFLIVMAPPKEKILPFQPPADQNKREQLIQMLTRIGQIQGEMGFTPSAKEYYEEWYMKFEKKCESGSGQLSPFYARLTEYAKKFAMLFAVDRRQSRDIIEEDCREACTLAETYAREITNTVTEEIALNHRDKERKKVENAIKSRYSLGISRSELLRETRIPVKELDQVLATLLQEERIKKCEQVNDGLTGASAKRVSYVWCDGDGS